MKSVFTKAVTLRAKVHPAQKHSMPELVSHLPRGRAVLTTLAPSRQQNSVTERADSTMATGRNALMGIGALILKSLRTVLAVYRPVNAWIPQRKNVSMPTVFG